MGDLLALSFLQPWLWAIVEGHKGFKIGEEYFAIENRVWRPHTKMIGERFALHASAGWDRDGSGFVLRQLGGAMAGCYRNGEPVRSAVVGMARLVGAVEIPQEDPRQVGLSMNEFDAETAREVSPGRVVSLSRKQAEATRGSPWTFGPWAWLLADVRRLAAPIPCKGALGFWKAPADVAARIAAEEGCHA
jgi:hypothetical protein